MRESKGASIATKAEQRQHNTSKISSSLVKRMERIYEGERASVEEKKKEKKKKPSSRAAALKRGGGGRTNLQSLILSLPSAR